MDVSVESEHFDPNGDEFGFLITWEDVTSAHANFTVDAVTGVGDDERVTEPYMRRSTIKFDACAHLYFGDERGYMHTCGGLFSARLHAALIVHLHERAAELMMKAAERESLRDRVRIEP